MQGQGGGSDKETHEPEFDAVLFEEVFTEFLSAVGGGLHVDLLESGEEGVIVLGLFEALGDSLSQSGHGFSGLFSF